MTSELQLFAELYDAHPQAIVWLLPVWNKEGTKIEDFEYTYINEEGMRYLNLTRAQLPGLRILNSPTLTAALRQQLLEDLSRAYIQNEKVEKSFFNASLRKYAHVISTRIRGGVLSVIEDKTAEHRIIEKLEAQSKFLTSVLDTSLNAVVTMDAVRAADGHITDFRYRQANRQFLNWLSRPEAEVIGHTMTQLFPNIRETGVFDLFTKVIATGEPIRTEIKFQQGNHWAWYDLSVVRLDEEAVVSTFYDITQNKEAFELIRQQKTLLDNILKHSSNGISVTEAIRNERGEVIDARTLIANDAAVSFTGLPREIYLSKTAVEVDPNIIHSDYYHLYVKTLETGQPAVLQYFIEHTGRWLELTISRMDKDHIIHIFTDITSVKEAQLALERSATQLQTIINRSQSGVFTAVPVLNKEGAITDFRFVIVNRTLAAYIQQEPEDLVGQLSSQLFSRHKEDGLFGLLCDTYQHHRVNRFDYHYVADGIDAWLDIMCTRFDGELLVTFTDYTPVKKLQLELQQSVEELRRSNANLQEFAYAASHDLQEPLRKISTFSDRLRHNLIQTLSEENKKLFERMEQATVRMKTLIEDLLAYSEVSIRPTQFKAVALNDIIQQAVQDLEASISESGAELHLADLPQINGDAPQLRQMFLNLLGNALKYRKSGVQPVITITYQTLSASDPLLENIPAGNNQSFHFISVQDNGIGFEQIYAEKIFQVFQRLHGNTEYKGTGVGLAIVQKVVTNHRGFIWAEGRPGEGARFNVVLPF